MDSNENGYLAEIRHLMGKVTADHLTFPTPRDNHLSDEEPLTESEDDDDDLMNDEDDSLQNAKETQSSTQSNNLTPSSPLRLEVIS